MESGSRFHKTEEAWVKERPTYVFVEVGGTMNNAFELDMIVLSLNVDDQYFFRVLSYIDASQGSSYSEASLMSPELNEASPSCLLEVWVHMYGTGIQHLSHLFNP